MTELYRKRLIPNECIHLSDDVIVYKDDNHIISKWKTLHPKAEFSHGISLYCMDKGWKISRFYNAQNKLCYIYCDIIETDYNSITDTYTFTDLLADVIIENNGLVRVVDIDELADAFNQKILTGNFLSSSLYRLNELLNTIYSGEINKYLAKLDNYDEYSSSDCNCKN